MESQLTLIDVDEDFWTLNEQTRQTGRRGIASAREALRAAAVASARQAPARPRCPMGSAASARHAA
ncbi:MAG: hypothetical protein M3R71_03675 [Actinomycetota bacterium]|nr:hypothetical protein [Actinomycetota bacterium]